MSTRRPNPSHPIRRVPAAVRGWAVAGAWFAGAAVTLAAFAPPALAQTSTDVQRAIDVTQGVLDRASGTLSCTPSDTRLGCQYLSQAISLQGSARSSYASGFLRDALALTLRARDRAYSALRTGQDQTGGEFVRFSLERTDALLDRVAPPVRESGVNASLRLLDVAFDLERRARQLVENGRPRVALTTTFQARERALRALRLAEGAAGTNPARAYEAVARTDELLRDAAWVEGTAEAAVPYGRAIATQGRAHQRLDAGDARLAFDLTMKAREELSLARADRPADRAAVERELLANAQNLELARTRAGTDAAGSAALERAEDHQKRAQDLFQQGRYAAALSEVRASKDALGRLR
jgi:hypothetical protein